MVIRILFSTIIGAIVLFAYGMFSWLALPFHKQTMNSFTNETAIVATIKENAAQSGIYVTPTMDAQAKKAAVQKVATQLAPSDEAKSEAAKNETAGSETPSAATETSPFIFVAVTHEGKDPTMKTQMTHAFIMNLVATFLFSLLLLYAARTSYLCRVSFSVIFGLLVGILAAMPMHIWFGFSTAYVLAEIVDFVIGWTLAGIFMAAFIKRPKES